MRLDRRRFLFVAGMAAGGFLIGCTDRERQQLDSATLGLKPGEIALNGWVKVAPSGEVTVMMPRAEMGQGVHTALMMLVAEELDCGWSHIRMENAPVDKLYGAVATMAEGIPFRPDDAGVLARSMRWTMTEAGREMGLMVTGGSSSVRDLWLPLRTAAAVTRATLLEAVAATRALPVETLLIREGEVWSGDEKLMSLGETVSLLGDSPQPASNFSLKTPQEFTLIGKDLPRVEAAAKVAGTATFGIDVRPEGLLHAAMRFAPARGGAVSAVDDAEMKAQPGIEAVVTVPPLHGGTGGIAVVAPQYWQARQAAERLQPQWDAGPLAGFSTQQGIASLDSALSEDEGFAFWREGDVAEALASAPTRLEARYEAPWLAHTPLEPMNCTVRVDAAGATVWAATQVPGLVRQAVADVLELDPDAVEVVVTYLGGGFGRRLEVDVAAQTAHIARALPGRPIKLIWSREDDIRHDFYRPACVARFEAGLAEDGRVLAWRNTSAGQTITPGFLGRNVGMPGMGPDKTASEGAYDQAYEFPHARVAHVAVDLPVPVGYWRSVGHSHQAFFKEGFLDECAHAAGADPLAYRLALLERHPRERALLEQVAAAAGWQAGGTGDSNRAQGIALHESFGTRVAMVVELVRQQGRISVSRVVTAVDCGLVVNPNLVTQQVESSVVYGLSAALGGRIDFQDGQVAQANFHDYPALSLAACPRIETHLMPSDAEPGGVGEPALPPLAPALANALFALTGHRVRQLPFALDEEARS